MSHDFIEKFFSLRVDFGERRQNFFIGRRSNGFNVIGVEKFGAFGNDFVILNVNRRATESVLVPTGLNNQRVVDEQTFGKCGVAVTVDNQINALRFAGNSFAGEFAACVNAHVHDGNHHVAFRAQNLNHFLGSVDGIQKINRRDVGGIRLESSFGRRQTEYADRNAFELENFVRLENELAVTFAHDICIEQRELEFFCELFQLRGAVIEIVVACCHCVESCDIEQRHEIFAATDCNHRHTVKSVACVEPKRRGIF